MAVLALREAEKMTPVEIITLISALIPAVSALVVAVIGLFHSIAAKVQSQNNATAQAAAHASTFSKIAVVEQNIHNIALALPSALQAITPQIQAVTAIPQVASAIRYATPALQNMDDVLNAIKCVADQVQALKPQAEEKVSATATGSSPLRVTLEEKK